MAIYEMNNTEKMENSVEENNIQTETPAEMEAEAVTLQTEAPAEVEAADDRPVWDAKAENAKREQRKAEVAAYIAAAAEIWTQAAAEMDATRFNVDTGKLEAVNNTTDPVKLQLAFIDEIQKAKPVINVPAALIDGDKIKLEAVNIHTSIYEPFPAMVLTVADDPVFKAPAKMTVYKAYVAEGNFYNGRYWIFKDNTLYLATDQNGQPVIWTRDTEGYKAKQARLKAEAEAAELERKRLAAIEAEEKEKARQAKQLADLAAIPTKAFNKLMASLRGE